LHTAIISEVAVLRNLLNPPVEDLRKLKPEVQQSTQ
jgi:hypothetical protein